MKKVKDAKKINQILQKGDITYLDPESGYRYSLFASCPNDDHDCSVSSFDKEDGEFTKITRVVFLCPICGNRFDATAEEMFLI